MSYGAATLNVKASMSLADIAGKRLSTVGTILTEIFLVFLRPSKQMPGQYLRIDQDQYFDMLYNSLFINSFTLQRYIICTADSVDK
jgi:hypothetical protein